MTFFTGAEVRFPDYRRRELPVVELHGALAGKTLDIDVGSGIVRLYDPHAVNGVPGLVQLLEQHRIDYDLAVEGCRDCDPHTDYVRFDVEGGRAHKRISEQYSRRMLAIVLEHLERDDGVARARWLLQQMTSDRAPLRPTLEELATHFGKEICF